jgi:hypothetical protein
LCTSGDVALENLSRSLGVVNGRGLFMLLRVSNRFGETFLLFSFGCVLLDM